MKNEIIIFGRSPFIHQVDVPALLPNYTTIGINRFSQDFKTDYCAVYDDPVFSCVSPCLLYPERFRLDCPSLDVDDARIEWYSPRESWAILPEIVGVQGITLLGFKGFTVSIALNFALLKNPAAVYLVGIDHNEQDTAFKHYDGVDGYGELTPDRHKEIKEYVRRANAESGIPVYQTNPDAQGWELPKKDLNELYERF